MRDLPIYDIKLNEDNFGLYAISLVTNPAMESNFIYMSEEEQANQFVFSDEEKREIIGAIIVPDKLIYRKMSGQEFYVKFTAETIKEINERMQQTDGNKYFTVEHELGANNSVRFLESWIKETEEDKSSAFGINEPVGSLFVKAKVESNLLWDMIKEEKLKGFSIEIDASLLESHFSNLKKENKMDYDVTSMYSNSLTVGDSNLVFNGELEVGNVVMTYNTGTDAAQVILPYSGTFTTDNVEYVIESGLVKEKTDIQLSMEDKLNSIITAMNDLLAKFEAMESSEEETDEEASEEEDAVNPLEEKINAVLSKIEEARLENLNSKDNEEAGTDDGSAMEFSSDDYHKVGEWLKKWN